MGKSSPTAPNPYTTAQAQTSSNLQTAAANQGYALSDANATAGLNRINQTNPYGSVSYGPNGQTTTLSPVNAQTAGYLQSDELRDIAQSNVGGAPVAASTLSQPNLATSFKNVVGTGIDSGSSNSVSTPIQTQVGYGGSDNLVSSESNQLQQSILQRLQPLEQSQTNALETQLRNQGLVPGTQAYQTAMLQNSQQQNDLALGAVSTADQEQQQVYNQALQNGQFTNQAQQQGFGQGLDEAQLNNAAESQGFQESQAEAEFGNAAQQQMFANQATAGQYADQQQYLPLQTAGALSSLSQGLSPTFSGVPQVSVNAPNVAGTNIGNLVQQSYGDQVQQASAQNSALGSILGSVGGAGVSLATGGVLPGLFGIGSSSTNAFGGSGVSWPEADPFGGSGYGYSNGYTS